MHGALRFSIAFAARPTTFLDAASAPAAHQRERRFTTLPSSERPSFQTPHLRPNPAVPDDDERSAQSEREPPFGGIGFNG